MGYLLELQNIALAILIFGLVITIFQLVTTKADPKIFVGVLSLLVLAGISQNVTKFVTPAYNILSTTQQLEDQFCREYEGHRICDLSVDKNGKTVPLIQCQAFDFWKMNVDAIGCFFQRSIQDMAMNVIRFAQWISANNMFSANPQQVKDLLDNYGFLKFISQTPVIILLCFSSLIYLIGVGLYAIFAEPPNIGGVITKIVSAIFLTIFLQPFLLLIAYTIDYACNISAMQQVSTQMGNMLANFVVSAGLEWTAVAFILFLIMYIVLAIVAISANFTLWALIIFAPLISALYPIYTNAIKNIVDQTIKYSILPYFRLLVIVMCFVFMSISPMFGIIVAICGMVFGIGLKGFLDRILGELNIDMGNSLMQGMRGMKNGIQNLYRAQQFAQDNVTITVDKTGGAYASGGVVDAGYAQTVESLPAHISMGSTPVAGSLPLPV